MDHLARPSDDVIRFVARVQATSFYPSFPEGYEPDEGDQARLVAKYGSADWAAIRVGIDRDHQGDPLLCDLSQQFGYRTATITNIDEWSQLADVAGRPAPSSATIGVLRYRERGGPAGHRIAWFIDGESVVRFFDPNIGEVTCPTDAAFARWLHEFALQTNYRRATPSGGPYLVAYSLDGVRPRPLTIG